MRLCLALSLLLLFPELALAQGATAFQGFYVGLGGGWVAMNVKAQRTGQEQTSASADDDAWQGAFFLGNGVRWGWLHLGVEAELGSRSVDVRLSDSERLSGSSYWGARLRLGGVFREQTMPYAALGVRFSSFRYQRDGYQALDGGSRLNNGPTLAAGLEQVLFERLLLRVEYCSTRWNDLEVDFYGPDQEVSRLTLKPESREATLALIWAF